MEHKTMLCVGGPLAGQKYASRDGFGFSVQSIEGIPDPDAEDWKPNAKPQVTPTHYRNETLNVPEGEVSFWVPRDQTPMQTMEILLECYEKAATR